MNICIPYQPTHLGGPSTFYRNLSQSLQSHGFNVTTVPTKQTTVMLTIIYAHPRLLLQAKRMGIPIIQRLDGVHYLAINGWKSLRYNMPIWINYRFFSNYIIFQSHYSRFLCRHYLGSTNATEFIIHNGVDTARFKPNTTTNTVTNQILSLLSDYRYKAELETAIQTYDYLRIHHPHLKLNIVGHISPDLTGLINKRPDIEWQGIVPRERVPILFRESKLLISTKLRQNCPNALLEAMASGLPTACFKSGAHYELIEDTAGICAPLPKDKGIGSLPELNSKALAEAAESILVDSAQYSQQARKRALEYFTLEKMVDRYLHVFREATYKK